MDTLSKDEILAQVVKQVSCSPQDAEKIFLSIVNVIKNGLLEGKRVSIPDFATMQVTEQKARISRDSQSGRQFIAPASRIVSIQPDKELQKNLDKAKLAAILLAVPKNDPFAKVVEFHFSRVGWKVNLLNSVESCSEALKNGGAYLCILDYSLPGAQKFIRQVKSKKETSLLPIIVLFPRGRDPERSDEFRICGDEHLAEPFEVYTLLMLAESELARTTEEEVIFSQQVCAQFPTTEENLDQASQLISELLKETSMSEEKQVAMSAAFREAILNAAQHGNRYNKDKQIKVLYLLDKEKITIVVSDEGEGFNHRLYLRRSESNDAVSAARERYEQGRLGGLGIMLMLRCTDRLEYSEKGNSITIMKYL